MPANPEFQELIIKKHYVGAPLTEVPEMQIYSLRHMKKGEFLKIILVQLLQLLFHQGCLPQN
jgi:hypothetical protein